MFLYKYTENDMKDKYVYSLHNKNSRNASLNYIAFLFYSGDSLGIPWEFPVTVIEYQGISQFGQDQGPWQ